MQGKSLFSHTFSTHEAQQLHRMLDIKSNPYQNYHLFLEEIQTLISTDQIPIFFTDICRHIKDLDLNESPAIILRNCPIDDSLPVFDHKEPVQSKYGLKKTFIAEAFLNLYSELVGSYPVGYKTINNGDLFHDIYPKADLLNSQSQKSTVTLGFHNDLPNNKVRPDWVNILCLRNSNLNRVSTTMIRNKDIIDVLDQETLDILKEPIFFTPHEVVSVDGGRNEEGIEIKPIYQETDPVPLCYFETRTQSSHPEGQHAIQELDRVLHEVKQPVFLEPGDFVSIANNYSLHAREVIHIGDREAHQKRWLCKTFNVDNIKEHQAAMSDGQFRVVDE